MANTPIHGQPGLSQTPLANIVRNIYVVAIVVIIGLMIIHWLLDLRKKIKNVSALKQVRRMMPGEVWQHTLLMVTFIVLVITGFALRYSESWWVNMLFGWEGGFPLRGIIHRVAAVVFVLSVIWHLFFLGTARGKQFIRDMWPRKRDLSDFIQMMLYNVGLSKNRPGAARFTYVEKAEYWALVWGTAIMIFSGFFLWFEDFAVGWFPKGFLDVMLVVHYYEALLATLSILIWHMYSTVFNPDVYPMNPSWYSGHMPLDWYRHEHPDDPMFGEQETVADSEKGSGEKTV
jgi:cytochrome b subunit of formate dehydrogenase